MSSVRNIATKRWRRHKESYQRILWLARWPEHFDRSRERRSQSRRICLSNRYSQSTRPE